MSKKINLYWYKHPKGAGNFGDELNPYIIGKITDEECNFINLAFLHKDKTLVLKILIKAFIDRRINFTTFFTYVYYAFVKQPKVFLAIGSVLQMCKVDDVIVWGSGIISSKSNVPRGKYFAVRGYKTIERLKELNIETPEVVGDPALLLPRLYDKPQQKKYDVSIIPHYIHYEKYKNELGGNYNVINLLDEIEFIIDEINQSELTISTSLHGIIVSHAYGVKSIRAVDLQESLSGDDVKFSDYNSSVQLQDYQPIEYEELFAMEKEKLIQRITNEYSNVLLPDSNIVQKIQTDLLEVFPFKVRENLI